MKLFKLQTSPLLLTSTKVVKTDYIWNGFLNREKLRESYRHLLLRTSGK